MLAVTVIALELGCGAGGGGSGAGGSGGSGGAAGSTSTITLDSKTICEQYCAAAIEAGCTDSSVSACAESCLDVYDVFPRCVDAFDHLYACYAEEVPVGGCNGQCPAQRQAMDDCLSEVKCGTTGCTEDETGCACSGTCFGDEVGVACSMDAAGAVHCTCSKFGDVVGECTGEGLICNVDISCCEPLF